MIYKVIPLHSQQISPSVLRLNLVRQQVRKDFWLSIRQKLNLTNL